MKLTTNCRCRFCDFERFFLKLWIERFVGLYTRVPHHHIPCSHDVISIHLYLEKHSRKIYHSFSSVLLVMLILIILLWRTIFFLVSISQIFFLSLLLRKQIVFIMYRIVVFIHLDTWYHIDVSWIVFRWQTLTFFPASYLQWLKNILCFVF